MTAETALAGPVVYLRPAASRTNPYANLFAEAIAREGIRTVGVKYSVLDFARAGDVLVVHWPDEFFYAAGASRLARAGLLLAELWFARLARGQKLVWVAHNLEPHRRPGRAAPGLRNAFFAAVDGIVFLSESSRDLVFGAYPQLAGRPHVVVAHGTYAPAAKTPPSPPRRPAAPPVRLLFAGAVRAYKAPDVLAAAVAALPPDTVCLTIAGACPDHGLRARLQAIADRAPNVTLRLDFLEEAEIEAVVDQSDAVVLPYREVLNSGSALFALSRNRPVVVPRIGSLEDLEHQVGPDWVYLYDEELTAETVRKAADWVAQAPRPSVPDLSAHDWSIIGRTVASFLRRLAERRR